jgi:hypothetical protein
MTNKNFSDFLASEMLTKLASKENSLIFGSQEEGDYDVSFAKDKKDKCKNCGCHKDECACGDMSFADDNEHKEVMELAENLKDFNSKCDKSCAVRVNLKDLSVVSCEDLDESEESLDANLDYSDEFRLPGNEERVEDDKFMEMAKSLLAKEGDKEDHEDDSDESETELPDEHSGALELEAAASYLLSASDTLDSIGFSKSAYATLNIAKFVIAAAKKKKSQPKSSKVSLKNKNTKKDTKIVPKSSKKPADAKSTKSTSLKKEDPKKQTKSTKSSEKASLPKKK